MSARDTQVGGDHYRKMAIQPIEYIQKNGLDFIQGNIVKYATRYPHKGQRVADLKKIIHYAQLALEVEAQQTEEITDADYKRATPSERLARIDALIEKHAPRPKAEPRFIGPAA